MVRRKRDLAEAEEELGGGLVLRLAKCRNYAFLQLLDSRTRLQHEVHEQFLKPQRSNDLDMDPPELAVFEELDQDIGREAVRAVAGVHTMLHARNGHRHGHVREQQFEDLRAEARELRSRMDAVLKLIKTPDLNLNAALERIIAAVVLHEAASSAA
ncbi:MAG: hypothetical protein SGPRY_003627, partial [Prymnesium sp.]